MVPLTLEHKPYLNLPTPSQALGENRLIFGQLKIHTCNQVLIKVQKSTKNIAP